MSKTGEYAVKDVAGLTPCRSSGRVAVKLTLWAIEYTRFQSQTTGKKQGLTFRPFILIMNIKRSWILIWILIVIELTACKSLARTPPVSSTDTPTPTTDTPTPARVAFTTPTPEPTLAPTNTAIPLARARATIKPSLTATVQPAARSQPQPTPAASSTAVKAAVRPARVFAVGDSVMLGAAGALKQAIDGVEVNAEVSRQISAIITMLRQRRAAGQLSSVVVIHTGDNSYISAKQFDEMMQLLIDVPRVVIVNLKVPRRWEAPNNQIIADGVSRYSNAVLVDWHSASVDRPDLFGKDGIHLRPEGARLFAELVAIQARAPETRRGRFEP